MDFPTMLLSTIIIISIIGTILGIIQITRIYSKEGAR
jgi:hypothetical protein